MRKVRPTGNQNLGYAMLERVAKLYEITRRSNKILTNLLKSDAKDSSIIKTLANLVKSYNESRFSLKNFGAGEFEINTQYSIKIC